MFEEATRETQEKLQVSFLGENEIDQLKKRPGGDSAKSCLLEGRQRQHNGRIPAHVQELPAFVDAL